MSGDGGHGKVFAHGVHRCIDGEDGAAVAGIVGEGGIVVSAGLHGIVPEPELPLFVVLRAAAVIEDAFHRGPDGADPFVVVQIFGSDDGACARNGFIANFPNKGRGPLGVMQPAT